MDQISSTRLHADLALRIIGLIGAGRLGMGDRLTEAGLAGRLQVSRTPVRAALALLAEHRVVEAGARGFVVAEAAPAAAGAAAESLAASLAASSAARPDSADAERLALAIAADRKSGRLPRELSEAELMRRYAVPRRVMKRLMGALAELGVAERKPGHGWLFLSGYADDAMRCESYRWRLIVEPAALLEPGYGLDPGWAEAMRERHERFLRVPWQDTAAVRFFTMNAAFHEGLCAGAGNRFLLAAMQQQTRLRRLTNYNWVFGAARVHQSCREHLGVLERLQAGDREEAASLLRRHIGQAMQLTRRAQGRNDRPPPPSTG